MNISAQDMYSINRPNLDTSRLTDMTNKNKTLPGDTVFSGLLDNEKNALGTGKKAEVTVDKSSKLYEQCEALEEFLLKNLINGMRKTVQKSNLIDTGFAGEMYEDMLYDEYTKEFAKNSKMGFAEMAYLELTGQRGKVINQQF